MRRHRLVLQNIAGRLITCLFLNASMVDKYISVKGGKLYTCFVVFQKAFDSVIHAGI